MMSSEVERDRPKWSSLALSPKTCKLSTQLFLIITDFNYSEKTDNTEISAKPVISFTSTAILVLNRTNVNVTSTSGQSFLGG